MLTSIAGDGSKAAEADPGTTKAGTPTATTTPGTRSDDPAKAGDETRGGQPAKPSADDPESVLDARMTRLGKALEQREESAAARRGDPVVKPGSALDTADADLDQADLDQLKTLSEDERKQSKNPSRTQKRLEKLWKRAKDADERATKANDQAKLHQSAHDFLRDLGKAGMDDAGLNEAVRVFLSRQAGSAEYVGWVQEEAKRLGLNLAPETEQVLPEKLQEAVNLGLMTEDQAWLAAGGREDKKRPPAAAAPRTTSAEEEEVPTGQLPPESRQFLDLLTSHGVPPEEHAPLIKELSSRVLELARAQGWVTTTGQMDNRKVTDAREALLFTQAFMERLHQGNGPAKRRPPTGDDPPPSTPGRHPSPKPSDLPGDINSPDIVERTRARMAQAERQAGSVRR